MTVPPSMPYVPPAPQPAKRPNGFLIAFVIAATVLLVGIAGTIAVITVLGTDWIGKSASSAPTNVEHTVTFKVTTASKTGFAYQADGAVLNETVSADWTKDAKVTGAHNVSLVVTLNFLDPDTASASCEILVDGKSQMKNSATGANGMAICVASTS
jgi:hypothetical protein